MQHQMGTDNINISNGLSIDGTPDIFYVSDDDAKDVVDAIKHSNWPERQVSMGEDSPH